jgi:phosphohistidine swiveling domain-containing protein
MIKTVSLDSESCRQPGLVGAKAARLAQARAAGLPVLDGFAVPCDESRTALHDAVPLVRDQGVHAARFRVMSGDAAALGALVEPAAALGEALVVRSSSPLEDSPQYAGAFTSFLGVAPTEIATAVFGVWASALIEPPAESAGPAGLEAPSMGVLVQPELDPVCAGTAEIGPTGIVNIVAIKGASARLMTGWDPGVPATISPDGQIDGARALELFGSAVLADVAGLIADVYSRLDDDAIEWAYADGRVWLLQSKRLTRTPKTTPLPPPDARRAGNVRPLHLGAQWPGDLAERWLLPWLVAPGAETARQPERRPSQMRHLPSQAAWHQFTESSDQLISQAWQLDRNSPSDAVARKALTAIRAESSSSDAMALTELAPVDPDLASVFFDLAECLTAHLLQDQVISTPAQFWALPPDISPLLRGGRPGLDPAVAVRRARLRWEPLLYSAVMAAGRPIAGTPVAPGIGCGPALLIDGIELAPAGEYAGLSQRPVLVAARPLPKFAPLLMRAAGIVTLGGSAAAHLVEVARSLGVPAVVACPLDERAGQPTVTGLIALDGETGIVSVLDDAAASR